MDKRPRIGIYDPYLFELGGGERYIAIFAETLQEHYRVEIISHDGTGISEIERRFSLDMSGVEKRELPTDESPRESLGGNWAHEFIRGRSRDRKKAAFTSDYDVFVCLSNGIPNYSLARKSIALFQMPYFADHRGASDSLRGRIRKLITGNDLTLEENLKLSCYTKKLSNSKFTHDCIAKVWGFDTEVVHTGLDTSVYASSGKENIILSVGRFQRDLFCKNQHLLVEAFKEMCVAGLDGWELYVVGGVSDKAADRKYFEQVRKAAIGFPVRLFPNHDVEELRRVYAKSRIFWHATGMTEDQDKEPWKMEHFGLTTVEAMASGCVPVVINKGGQPEIVTDRVDGYLWNSSRELMDQTWHLMKNTRDEEKLRRLAIDRSRDFDISIFRRNIRAIVGSLHSSRQEAFAS